MTYEYCGIDLPKDRIDDADKREPYVGEFGKRIAAKGVL